MRIEEFKDIHKGERCFILGNGPSLNHIDLSLLKNEFTLGCNHIYLMKGFKPTYWCIADYWVMEKIKEDVQKTYPDIIKFSARVHNGEELTILPKTCCFNMIEQRYDYNGSPNFSDDLSKGLYGGYSIAYVMIQLANYMGFDEIYLLGIDGIKDGNMYSFFPGAIIAPQFKKQTDLSHIAFNVARGFLEEKGSKIYNATPNSSVKSFKIIKYEDLFR